MSSDKQNPIVIKGISKRYRIAHLQHNHHNIKDAIVGLAKKPLDLLGSTHSKYTEEMWALDDVSFEVKPGQVVAVMGRNGSGKSTLFKIISRITTPTSGEVVINGRVGSLIEVDAGFHPELTGRENVYFHGSILGMTTEEINRNFDSILEFAEMDKFIDTPVKFYSSGMKVRLAFSVAIHMETDILLLDEVLAVGDYIFKQKCFKVIDNMAKQGKTILFVSHIPAHIHRVCTDAVLLRDGKLVMHGPAEEILDEYLKDLKDGDAVDEDVDEQIRVEPAKDVEIKQANTTVEMKNGYPQLKLDIDIENISKEKIDDIRILTQLKDEGSSKLARFSNTYKDASPISMESGQKSRVSFTVPNIPLAPGNYFFWIHAKSDSDGDKKYHTLKKEALFTVDDYNVLERKPGSTDQVTGPLVFDYDYEITRDI